MVVSSPVFRLMLVPAGDLREVEAEVKGPLGSKRSVLLSGSETTRLQEALTRTCTWRMTGFGWEAVGVLGPTLRDVRTAARTPLER